MSSVLLFVQSVVYQNVAFGKKKFREIRELRKEADDDKELFFMKNNKF
jgi:hypothetical protein